MKNGPDRKDVCRGGRGDVLCEMKYILPVLDVTAYWGQLLLMSWIM